MERSVLTLNSLFLVVISLFMSSFSPHLKAKPLEQTVILIGGALIICSSMNEHHCIADNVPSGKQSKQYRLSKTAIAHIDRFWPFENEQVKVQTFHTLNRSYSRISSTR